MTRDTDRGRARARAPGSVTTAFAPADAGGGGISLATAAGVTADVTLADETRVTLDGDPTSFDPVTIALDTLGVTADVALTAAIPVGRGFGASGAATLATVFAADAAAALGRDSDDLVTVAADAEVAAGTGQSDVFVQEAGGLAFDVGDGRGRRERTDRVGYASFGPIPTTSVLGDTATMARVADAAHDAFADFDPDAPLSAILDAGWRFARATGLPTDRVRRAVAAVREAGAAATMAMVGETLVATPDAPLSAPVFDDAVTGRTRVTTDGVRRLDRED